MNGSFLAEDTGSTKPRISYWYIVIGAIWLTYRILIIRRSYVLCRRYGQRCDSMGERLQLHEAVLFAQESLRLSAHGATNCQRVALLYVIIEGIMTDLFLIIANDGWAIRVQYVSLGYNLSGLVLLLFEILERTKWLKEKWRLRIKQLFFSYETTLVGELVITVVFQTIVTGLNKSDFKRSKPTAIAVSYYLWSLICHGAVVLVIISVISAVRVPLAVLYVWFKHGSMLVFSAPCCVDTVLGARSRLMMLGGYCVQNNQLYYKKAALKAFGMLKTEEDCAEYLGQRVEPCDERICMGDIRFLGQKIGGTSNSIDSHHRNSSISAVKVMAWSGPNDGILPSQTKSQNV